MKTIQNSILLILFAIANCYSSFGQIPSQLPPSTAVYASYILPNEWNACSSSSGAMTFSLHLDFTDFNSSCNLHINLPNGVSWTSASVSNVNLTQNGNDLTVQANSSSADFSVDIGIANIL